MNDIGDQPERGNLVEKSREGKWPGRFFRLRSHWVMLAGLAFLSLLLIVVGTWNTQASLDQSVAVDRQPKDMASPLAYQFTGQGKLMGGSEGIWVVGGVRVLADDQTKTEGKIHPGDMVSLVGHILEDGTWQAERIVPITEEDSSFSFAGPLESKAENHWQVAGITLAVDGNTFLGEDIPLGEIVLATFQVQPDESWLALQIQSLSDLEQSRTPTVTPVHSPTQTPVAPGLKPAPNNNPPNPKKPPKSRKPPKPKRPPKHKGFSAPIDRFASQNDLFMLFDFLDVHDIVFTFKPERLKGTGPLERTGSVKLDGYRPDSWI